MNRFLLILLVSFLAGALLAPVVSGEVIALAILVLLALAFLLLFLFHRGVREFQDYE